jgi:hypothetical protein
MASSWIETAEDYVSFAFGSRGKYIHLSRMIDSTDIPKLQTSACVGTYRPRGILSGFLVIHPQLQYAVFLPSASQTKQQPVRLHVRIAPSVLENGGLIALAYLYNKQLVVEDLIAVGKQTVWQKLPFVERWKRLQQFLETEFMNDSYLQDKYTITSQTYVPLAELAEPSEGKVVEFVVCDETGPAHRRLLWIPPREDGGGAGGGGSATCGGTTYLAKRESSMGPDVYSLYDGDKKLGIALIRTLVASKALRLAFNAGSADTVRVVTAWNKQFDKWEILGVAA